MAELPNPFNTQRKLPKGQIYYSLPALQEQTKINIPRFPVSIRIILESLLRNCDGLAVKEENIRSLLEWNPKKLKTVEVPFVVARVLLQDFTGVPLLVDLAAMRDAIAKQGFDASLIEPDVSADLIIDHSVQVDKSGSSDAFEFNLKVEAERNMERYAFLKWGQQAFKTFKVVPPGIGICHQVNLEHVGKVVVARHMHGETVLYPDTLVGTDSHTTMINGLGVLGWGVGGIEAEAAMLGQPYFMPMPEVVGVHLSGALQKGVTATDLTLRITELLRKEKVVGKLIEFYGEGAASLTVQDRATIGNMAPEYGATSGFFPVDEQTLVYLRDTGRSEEHIQLIKEYLTAQKLFGIPRAGEVDYSKVLELDLKSIKPCVSGPKRPQDRIDLPELKKTFLDLLTQPSASGGYDLPASKLDPKVCVYTNGFYAMDPAHDSGGKPDLPASRPVEMDEAEMVLNRPIMSSVGSHPLSQSEKSGDVCEMVLSHGSVVIAAITSCTNTSNPSVMIGAGLLAKKAIEKGLRVNPLVKTSLAPGSRIVTDYLEKAGLQKPLNELGFQLVAYGCTTCIGNSGPLDERIETAIKKHDVVAASVLSGNRNFEARIHSAVKANFLMSPPLVVAFAIAGRVNFDMEKEPLGHSKSGEPVYLKDIWPSEEEIQSTIRSIIKPDMYSKRYSNVASENPLWQDVQTSTGTCYAWVKKSTYIQEPPYFAGFSLEKPKAKILTDMRTLAIFGDSVTTDHISPAGLFHADTPAGKYLVSKGVKEKDFNSYGSRRGNHEVMIRGTFANVRIRNFMADGKEGGFTKLMPEGTLMLIFDACQLYADRKIPLIVFAGKDYGMGSSRDWAAKGPALLGVNVVVANSFERIHRSNLIGMGVLPLEFKEGETTESLGITGNEVFSIRGVEENIKPQQEVILEVVSGEKKRNIPLIVRLDTMIEVEYYTHGGILPYVLRKIIEKKKGKKVGAV